MKNTTATLNAPINNVNTSINNAQKKASTARGIILSLVVNAALPFVIYQLLKTYTNVSDLMALFVSGVPSIIVALTGVVRERRVDLMAGITLTSIAVSIVLIALGGSPKLYLVRESLFTGVFGLVYLVSLLFPRPMAFYFARHFVTGNVPEKVARFNSLWQSPFFQHGMRVSTVVWGLSLIGEAVIRIVLVVNLTIAQFLLVSPFVLYGILGGMMAWTMWYGRQMRRQGEVMHKQA